MNTRKWTTREGKKLQIKDMTNTHLGNTIKMLEDKAKEYARGHDDWEDYVPEVYWDLKEELINRQFENERNKNLNKLSWEENYD